MWQNLPLFPDDASTLAGEVDALYFFLVAVSVFFSLLISGLLLYLSVRYRRSRSPKSTQIHGSYPLEAVWTGIPLVLTLIMFGWGAKLYVRTYTPPTDAIDFYVTGKQWMWKIQHPTGQREINELHIPADTPIKLTMSSEDVIHSFFVPAFRAKRDVLPGRFTTMWFEATEPGEYHLLCTEYCGTKHSEMVGTVTVMEPDAYEAWLEGAPIESDPVAAGERLFEELRCQTCHAEDSTSRGPSLRGRFGGVAELAGGATVPFDADYVRRSILQPKAELAAGYPPLMPTYEGQLREEDLVALVAYIASLGGEDQ